MRRPATRPAALAALLLAAAVASGPWAGPAAASLPRDVTRLAREHRERRLAVRPDRATRAGDRRGDARLEPVTQASLAAEAAWLRDFAARIAAVPRDRLADDARAALDSLAAATAREHAEIALARRWERDPAAYLELVEDAVRELLPGRGRSTCGRARAVARRLARVPDVLRAARVNLREPAAERVAAALPGYERTLRLYRAELPAFGARCREPRVQADLAEADTLAVRAVEGFLRHLREDLPAAGGPGRAPPR